MVKKSGKVQGAETLKKNSRRLQANPSEVEVFLAGKGKGVSRKEREIDDVDE